MSQDVNVNNIRQNYSTSVLAEDKVDKNPFKQFQIWFDEACATDFVEPNAMSIATIDSSGVISSRMVLLKAFDEAGFVFFTNYNSKKAKDLENNKTIALNFWWDKLYRQVRIQGYVEKVTKEESEEYFHSRPRGSQIGAIASQQSEVIDSYKSLETQFQKLEAKYENTEIPYPEHWGGYRVIPDFFEFWQGRPNRLHDRLRYTKTTESWNIERLSP